MKNRITPIQARCLILDGDEFAAEKVGSYLSELPCIKLVGSVADAAGAREIFLRNEHLDVIFIGTGKHNAHAFDIASQIRDRVRCIVFIGEDSESALKAFQVGGDHFLRWPLLHSEFRNTIEEVIAKTLGPQDIKISEESLRIPIRIDNYKN